MRNIFGEVQTHTDPSQWRHVSIKFNPADEITRGTCPLGRVLEIFRGTDEQVRVATFKVEIKR